MRDRLRIVTILAGNAGQSVRRILVLPRRAAGALRRRAPERLLIAPQDIRTADPTIAADILAGYFAFGGKIVNAHGQSPFAIEAASEAWARQLAGFGWLRHLRAAEAGGARPRGRVLIDNFLTVHGRPGTGLEWEPQVAARRLLSWLSQSPVVLEGADRGFYNRFMQAIGMHRSWLERRMSDGLAGDDRLLTALALAEYGLCAQGSANLQRRSSEALAAALDAQVLPDGGHVSRNPQVLIDLLLDLLPLRQVYAARSIQVPQELLNAIDRMMPMLRAFRHGDGTLALFNGMGLTAPELVATILAYDDSRAQPVVNARYAGYQRIEAGQSVVIADAGPVPPKAFSTQAHAGCLAFELSSGMNRIIINCGAPEGARLNARDAARTTAAHSTLVLDDTSSCRFASNAGLKRWLGDQILAGPVAVTAERSQQDGRTTIAMSHDGYAARFGLVHHRSLSLSADGERLDGEDRLTETGKRKPGAVPYVLRFHIHPSLKPRLDGEGAVRIDARDGESWLFESEVPAELEPSILFAAIGGARATLQIKVAANSRETPQIRWVLRRLTPPQGRF